MRVLHVGWGYSPWRHGGLIHYAEDLMDAQVERGHEVAYFFSGRHYARPPEPRLQRWERRGVAMHEVVNCPVFTGLEHGTRHPERDLDEPFVEEAFRSVLRSFRPDVVHIQELMWLPSSLLEVAADEEIGTVMTLQDYLPLCSTLRLFDADGRFCERLQVGEDCALRNAKAPKSRRMWVWETRWFELEHLRQRLGITTPRRYRIFHALARRAYALRTWRVDREPSAIVAPGPDGSLAAAFQRRRDVNVERLGRAGRLVAQSPRVAEIYEARGVPAERLTTLRFTLAHIERLRPVTIAAEPHPIRFATLGGCASETKGMHVIVGALRGLRERGLGGRFRLRVLGGVHKEVRRDLTRNPDVELHELYDRTQLDEVLDGVDVGIMPSIWEEAFGYAGAEMLAKGIPLIANPLGGMVEYAREGETAWLNESCSADGLAQLMAMLIAEPQRVVDMHARVLAARDELVRPLAEHVGAMEEIYREVGARSPGAPARS